MHDNRGVSAVPALVRANGLLAGWLALIPTNAVFVQRVHVERSVAQQTLHHLYDAGHLLGLGLTAWLLGLALGRLQRRPRLALAMGLAIAACYGLLSIDLESFIERTGHNPMLTRVAFAFAGASCLAVSAVAAWLAARHPLRFLLAGVGIAAAIGNHLVLPLAYPGTHFILAWVASLLIGVSLTHDLATLKLAPRLGGAALALAAAGALASYLVVPRAVVRGALLGSSGAVAAPFAAEAWTALAPEAASAALHYDPDWVAPRRHLPPIPAVRPPKAPDKPIVVLLTVDALRADVVDGPKADKKAVKNIRKMAAAGLSFQRAWSPSAYTMGSLRSLFLGIYYFQQHAKPLPGSRKPIKGPFLASLLGKRGVSTVNIKAVRTLGVSGSVCRGFAEEIKPQPRTSVGVVSSVLERIEQQSAEPLFIYSHIIDPHSPYTLGGKKGSPKERYIAEVAFVDRQIGRLRSALRKRGLDGRTYFILSADHGEAFGEHGHEFHSSTVYQEMIHIPLIIEGPGIPARRIATPISLIDLAPTILSLFGVDTPAHFMGESLVPFMRGEDPQLTRPLAVDGGRAIRAMLFDGRWKPIIEAKRGTEELYDLQADPGERRNLAEGHGARGYLASLRAFFASAK